MTIVGKSASQQMILDAYVNTCTCAHPHVTAESNVNTEKTLLIVLALMV